MSADPTGAKRSNSAPRRVPGLDYLAEAGGDPNLSMGVIQAIGPDNTPNTMESSVCRRLFPHQRPANPNERWSDPTCFYSEVLPPKGMPDQFWTDPQALCRAYDAAAFPTLRDVMINITLRAPELESNGMRIHEYHSIVTRYVRHHILERGLPTIVVVHVPSRAGRSGPVHWHCLVAARRWSPIAGPSTFCCELLTGDGRSIIEREWGRWKRLHGLQAQ